MQSGSSSLSGCNWWAVVEADAIVEQQPKRTQSGSSWNGCNWGQQQPKRTQAVSSWSGRKWGAAVEMYRCNWGSNSWSGRNQGAAAEADTIGEQLKWMQSGPAAAETDASWEQQLKQTQTGSSSWSVSMQLGSSSWSGCNRGVAAVAHAIGEQQLCTERLFGAWLLM